MSSLSAASVGTLKPGRRLHDEVLARFPKHRYFVNDSLLDDVYFIRTDNPEERRYGTIKIDFTTPVAPGPELLTDPDHADDLLTAKICLIYAFDQQLGWAGSALSIRPFFTSLVNLVRWRNSQGIHRFRDLTSDFFESYLDVLAERGSRYLLPLEERIEAYLQRVRDGREKLPIKSGRLSSNEVARKLGLSLRVQVPDEVWRPVLEELQRQDPRAFQRTKPFRPRAAGAGVKQHMFWGVKPWGVLYGLQEVLDHDPLSFEPWDIGETAWSVSGSVARRTSVPTPLPPVKQTCFLINAALDFVQNSSKIILCISEIVDQAYRDYPEDAEQRARAIANLMDDLRSRVAEQDVPPWLNGVSAYRFVPTYRGEKKSGHYIRDIMYKLLPGACAVVIAAFTVRRHNEMVSMRDGCLYRDEEGRLFLSSWASKYLRRLDSIPVPESIAKAVDVLAVLSQRGRSIGRNKWLFNFRDPDGGVAFPRFDELIRAFAQHADLPPLPDGTLWQPLPQQFRVFFPTMYYHRFDYPSLTALSRLLKHHNTDTTRTYVTNAVRGSRLQISDERVASKRSREACKARRSAQARASAFEEVRANFLHETADAIATGAMQVGGGGGRQWTNDLQALVAQAESAARFSNDPSSADLATLLRSWLVGKALEPHPQGHSFCKCTALHSDLAAAGCLAAKFEREGARPQDQRGPDLAYAADEICAVCPHNLTLPCNLPYWRDALCEAESVTEAGALATQRESARVRVKKIRAHVGHLLDES